MLTQQTSQMDGAPPLPAPPLSSPGRGWDLGAPWVVRDHNITQRDHDEASHHLYVEEVIHQRQDCVGRHLDVVGHHHENNVGHHRDIDVGHHRDIDVGHHRDNNVGHHADNDLRHHCDDVSQQHENNLGVTPPNTTRPPLQEGPGLSEEQQLLPLSLLKEALAPLCLRLAAVEAGLERLWLHLPLLVMQRGGIMLDEGGAMSGGMARKNRTKGEENEMCYLREFRIILES